MRSVLNIDISKISPLPPMVDKVLVSPFSQIEKHHLRNTVMITMWKMPLIEFF
jgi:hypothetical protein